MKPPGITFDAGGTLIQPWPSVGQVYADVAAQHGWTGISAETLDCNFAQAWRRRTAFRHLKAEWADLVDQTFAGMTDPPPSRSFFPAIYERFAEPEVWRIYDDVRPALRALASIGARLAVVSNWDERLGPLLRSLGLNTSFQSVVVSCEVGVTKPSPGIFLEAARSLGLTPESILHVGDSYEEDIVGARAAGFQALLVDRRRPSLPGQRIASLRELPLVGRSLRLSRPSR